MKRLTSALFCAAVLGACLTGAPAHAQSVGTGFTYQGKLTDGDAPATGVYDFVFRLYDAASGGSVVGPAVTLDNVQVTGGLFTVELNFGNQFNGSARWVEVSVRPGASTGVYTTLSTRQKLTPAPYAISAGNLQLPFYGVGNTTGGLLDSGLFTVAQLGPAPAIKGSTQGAGAAVKGEATAAGAGVFGDSTDGIGVRGSSHTGTAGWFEITNQANGNTALFGRTAGAGYAIYAQSTGVGKALGAIQNGASGEAGHFRVTGFGNQSAAVRAETDNAGAAVYAKSQYGPALQINRGYIKIDGAGLNTSTPAFIHEVTSSNRVGQYNGITVIDHPLCNNDPNAILIVTPRLTFGEQVPREPIGVMYGYPAGRWAIYTLEDDTQNVGWKYNVLVIKP